MYFPLRGSHDLGIVASGTAEKAKTQLGTSIMVTKALSLMSAPRRIRLAEMKKVDTLNFDDQGSLDIDFRCKEVVKCPQA